MGCYYSTETSDPEEIISDIERNLLFSEVSTTEIVQAFRENSQNRELTKTELLTALTALGQDNTFFTKRESIRRVFYSHLLEDGETIALQKLVCIAVLFGNDANTVKSEYLFEFYDANCVQELSFSELRNMMNDIIQISIDLILKTAKAVDWDSTVDLNRYSTTLSLMRKEYIKEYFLKLLMEQHSEDSVVSRGTFIESMEQNIMFNLLEARKFRVMCSKVLLT